jgi:alpha-N-acetylglucosamine transferase
LFDNYENPLFDIIVKADVINGTYGNKINGILQSPFYKTLYLDGDTFICAPIDDLFDVLDLFDMSLMPDPLSHSYLFLSNRPDYKIVYEKIVPEFQMAVIIVSQLLEDWLETHARLNIVSDMTSFRDAYLRFVGKVSINPLPIEYNYNGTLTFAMLYNEVKIIHEKIQERRDNLRLIMADFKTMENHAKSLNKYNFKRLVIPYFGPIPFYYSPYLIKRKIKKILGVKRKLKEESF